MAAATPLATHPASAELIVPVVHQGPAIHPATGSGLDNLPESGAITLETIRARLTAGPGEPVHSADEQPAMACPAHIPSTVRTPRLKPGACSYRIVLR